MIVRLTGTLIDLTEEAVVIERDGVAREVLIPRFSLGELAASRGRSVTLHTLEFYEGNHASGHLVPRVIGFVHPEDREFFERFLDVKGIGLRKALKALSEPVRKIATWIESGDVKALAKLPGIGARASDMIVATLKGKVKDFALPSEVSTEAPATMLTQAQRDALEVLVAWGDPRNDAQRWIERAAQLHPDADSPADVVRVAYRVKTGVEG